MSIHRQLPPPWTAQPAATVPDRLGPATLRAVPVMSNGHTTQVLSLRSGDAQQSYSRRTSSSVSAESQPSVNSQASQPPHQTHHHHHQRTTTGAEHLPSPELSPNSRFSSRKRSSAVVELDEQIDSGHEGGPARTSPTSATHVCLCQPDPKIPRPRNAFILYRQHHQGAIVAQYPGLANPEISKIIGDQWRKESPDVKNDWKRLAEEEKARHQQQYPEYRYQPRRSGRRGSISDSSVLTSPGKPSRCAKCGGRSIASSNPNSAAPSSAGLQSSGQQQHYLPPLSPSAPTPSSSYNPMLSNPSPQSPTTTPRRARGPMYAHVHGPPRPGIWELKDGPPISPGMDPKRRRFEGTQYHVSTRERAHSNVRPVTPYPPGLSPSYYREALPSPSPMLPAPPHGTVIMGPPPRPDHTGNYRPPDANLTLAPIRNEGEGSHPATRSSDATTKKTVEEVVMSIPPMGKVRVLGKISPPYKCDAHGRPLDGRGCIIAVEGDNAEAVEFVSHWLETELARSSQEVEVRTFREQSPAEDAPASPTSQGKKPAREHPSFSDYFAKIQKWHIRSQEIVNFIDPSSSPDSHADGAKAREDNNTSTSPPTTRSHNTESLPRSTPVALIPQYQLSLSNHYASRIDIDDAYSAADHWQWMATLWRGIVGPDLTVYVRDASKEEMARDGGRKGVEVRDEVRSLILRRERSEGAPATPAGGNGGNGAGAGLEERHLRRLGFEVSEWVRMVANGEGKGGVGAGSGGESS